LELYLLEEVVVAVDLHLPLHQLAISVSGQPGVAAVINIGHIIVTNHRIVLMDAMDRRERTTKQL